MVGTPEHIADQIEEWFRCGAADGFNLMPPWLPNDLDDFVDHVVQGSVADQSAQLPGRDAGIGGLGDGADDDDAARPGIEDLGQPVDVDATDGEPRGARRRRSLHEPGNIPDKTPAGGGTAGLGGGLPQQSGAEVIDLGILDCRTGLIELMGGTSDQHLGAE